MIISQLQEHKVEIRLDEIGQKLLENKSPNIKSATADDWSTYSGNGFSPYAYGTSASDGFMPTDGKYFFKCLPYSFINGTYTKQFNVVSKHFKGFYFDYSYIGKSALDKMGFL